MKIVFVCAIFQDDAPRFPPSKVKVVSEEVRVGIPSVLVRAGSEMIRARKGGDGRHNSCTEWVDLQMAVALY